MRTTRLGLGICCSLLFFGYHLQTALAAPTPHPAYYYYDTTLQSLENDSYNRGVTFAQGACNAQSARLLINDYGAARKISQGVYGTQIFGNSGVTYDNANILLALQYSADGVHHGYCGGIDNIVAYGNNNSYMTQHGMTWTDANNAGSNQSNRAEELYNYQVSQGYNHQTAAIAQDQEPGFDSPGISKQLTDGATNQGWATNYDFGSADACYPDNNGGGNGASGTCANGWHESDIEWVSYSGTAWPLPEIYYNGNGYAHQPDQWKNVRVVWNSTHSTTYQFMGTTGSTGVQLTAQQGYDDLYNLNSSYFFDNQLACFGC
ncbi:MAG TPA: hypothetical protein VFU33_03175 [Gaiellaceae bacterium]|nr:hypothetical protein [Gaiellaceae bacterium]